MRTIHALSICTILALAGCLSEETDLTLADDPQAEEEDGTTTIAAFGGDNIKFTAPTTWCVGAFANSKVSLLSDPAGSVTVTVVSGAPSRLIVGPPSSVTFDSSDWGYPKLVKLKLVNTSVLTPITVTASSPGYTDKSLSVQPRRCY